MQQPCNTAEMNYRPVDRYLAPAAIREASEVLGGLAHRLTRVEGVWADDARADAERLRELASLLRGWCPHPDSALDQSLRGADHQLGHDYGAQWPAVLDLYLE